MRFSLLKKIIHTTSETQRVFFCVGMCAYKKLKKHPARAGCFFNLFTTPYARDTFVAAGPFSPSTTSKVTASPTFNSLKVTPCNSFEWKKRSFDSPSRAMNPNPRSVSVLIVPFIRSCLSINTILFL